MCRRMRHLKPREIQGCQLALDASIATSLYDATSGGSLVAADGVVKRWEDQSGNGYNVTEATNGPQRKVATMNGRDTLYFDGTNDKLTQSAASQSKFLHVAAGATFAAVAHFGTSSNPAATYVLFDNHGTTLSKTGVSSYYDDVPSASDRLAVTVARSVLAQPTSVTLTNSKITPNSATSITTVLDNANATAGSRQLISVNGAAEYGGNVETRTAATADPSHALTIGCLASSVALVMLGYVSEINGWNHVLSDAVRKRVSNSRQRKWRING